MQMRQYYLSQMGIELWEKRRADTTEGGAPCPVVGLKNLGIVSELLGPKESLLLKNMMRSIGLQEEDFCVISPLDLANAAIQAEVILILGSYPQCRLEAIKEGLFQRSCFLSYSLKDLIKSPLHKSKACLDLLAVQSCLKDKKMDNRDGFLS